MALGRYSEITCDSCNVYNDGDPMSVIEMNLSAPAHLQNFWLCRECLEYYPNGAKDFFTPEYFNGESEEDDSEDYDY
jgi:hypothetical protein